MKEIRTGLTIILLIYFVPTTLSVLDILKGSEPDLSTEWIVVCIYLLLSIAYSLVNLFELLRESKKDKTSELTGSITNKG